MALKGTSILLLSLSHPQPQLCALHLVDKLLVPGGGGRGDGEVAVGGQVVLRLELETNLREVSACIITEKAPTITINLLLRQYAKRLLGVVHILHNHFYSL